MSEGEFRAFNEAWIRAALSYLVEGGVLGTFIDWRGLAAVQGGRPIALGLRPNACV